MTPDQAAECIEWLRCIATLEIGLFAVVLMGIMLHFWPDTRK